MNLSAGPPREILKGATRLHWGPRNRLRLLSKLSILGPGYIVNVSEDQQPEFRSLSESYIIITHLKKFRTAEGGAKIVGVFRVNNHDFTPKNHIFSNFRGARAGCVPPLDPALPTHQ